MGAAPQPPPRPPVPPLRRALNQLASVKFAVTMVALITVACIAGTLLPQGADVAKFVEQNPGGAARMELFAKLGLTNVFYSWWFIGLLCVLAASVFTCSTRRFATVRRTAGYSRWHALGSMITHISFLLILGGGVIRGVWGEKGYLEFREGETRAQFITGAGARALPFGIQLAKFEVETYDQPAVDEADACGNCNHLVVAWPERGLRATLPIKLGEPQRFDEFTITLLKYVPDFTVDMETRQIMSRSEEPRNPAVYVAVDGPTYQNHKWLFARFPDFSMHGSDSHATAAQPSPLTMVYVNHGTVKPQAPPSGPIKSYKSTLKLIANNTVVREQQIEVNSPLRHQGYTFYQSGWNPRDLSYTALQVVKDPGVPVVYAGFTLMIVGLFIVFYLNPWLNERVSKRPSAQAPKHLAT